MPRREYNINNSEDERLVLRSLVGLNNKIISGIYNSANFKRLDKTEMSVNLSKIFDTIGGVFLSRDYYASRFCANTKSWQDYLSCEDLFKLYMFQSIVINKVSN